MTWRGLWSIFLAGGLFLLAAVSVSADTTPQAPAVSGGVQPVSASAGSPSQSNGTISVSSGRASGSTDNGVAEGNTCGVQAGAAGNGYAAQPTSVGSTGSSTPTGCTSGGTGAAGQGASAGAGSNANNLQKSGTQAGANTPGASRSTLETLGLGGIANAQDATRRGAWLWLFLAVLLAVFFFILGVVIAPKQRRSNATAS